MLVQIKGVATGGGGEDVSPRFEIMWGVPPEIAMLKENFMNINQHYQIFHQYFQIKWTKSEGKSEFGGRWF